MKKTKKFSPYMSFTSDKWRQLRNSTPLLLSEAELNKLLGLIEQVSLDEVANVYLPLSRLLNLYVANSQHMYQTTKRFLCVPEEKVPYIIGIAGSVAVGKSTTARILQTLLSRWPNHPKVDLVTTDGFLYPNAELEKRGLMKRKGFPESYDIRALMKFLAEVKSGNPEVVTPVYSHLVYDIVPNEYQVIRQPDIVIVEGLNVLQTTRTRNGNGPVPQLFVSDFFDISLYVDANVKDISRWYVERFKLLRHTAFKDPTSYFRRYADLSDDEATEKALSIWREINERNLLMNILPTRARADIILRKGPNHDIQEVKLRKL
ncbi:type I pantothenate kinase [Numidum massiliense]|uniref:type I pantothenate kinase n=1 Tax=Numidum massiliense TaxID=1522315 RepID=UPI0006D56DAD|nr:type I pantothenate kinase [Numidum massiliense]